MVWTRGDMAARPKNELEDGMGVNLGIGIPGFYTTTGVGTVIAQDKEHKDFDGETYILERAIVTNLAIVKGWKADDTGNLVFCKTVRIYSPPAAMCGRVCVAEVEGTLQWGSLDPGHIGGVVSSRPVAAPVSVAVPLAK